MAKSAPFQRYDFVVSGSHKETTEEEVKLKMQENSEGYWMSPELTSLKKKKVVESRFPGKEYDASFMDFKDKNWLLSVSAYRVPCLLFTVWNVRG